MAWRPGVDPHRFGRGRVTAEMVDLATGEILPPSTDLANLDPSEIDKAADPGAFVVLCCERAKTWLAQAVEQGDIDSIVETKSQAEAIRVYTIQKQLGKDAELSAAEIVRRAERGIGVAIRRGQQEGTIATREEARSFAGQVSSARRLGNNEPLKAKPTPGDIVPVHELSDNGAGIYHLTDGVSDDQFEAALTAAKAEGNLSRAHLVRKVKGEASPMTGRTRDAAAARLLRIRELADARHSSRQIAAAVGMTEEWTRELCRREGIDVPADKIVGRTRKHDANRIVEQAVLGLEGYALSVSLIDFEQLDRSQIAVWSRSLSASLQSLNRLSRQLKELDQT